MAFVGTGRAWSRRARTSLALTIALGLTLGCGGTPTSAEGTGDGPGDSSGQEAVISSPGPETSDGDGSTSEPVAVTYRFDPSEIPSQGPSEADVVVDVFSDFECPYCSLARRHTARLLEDFPSVRVRYRHYPLAGHPHSGMAAEASVDVYAQGGNEAFWCFHDQVFDHQSELSRDLLLQLAARCRVSAEGVRQALADHRHQARVEQDRAAGDDVDVQGTPTFTVNGEVVDGGDYADIEEAVDHVHPSW